MRTRTTAGIAGVTLGTMLLASCSGGGAPADADNTVDGEPSGEITVVTWRTDLIADGTFDEYKAEFEELYPEVTVEFEGITDYEGEMKTRLSTTSYGDVIGIPTMQQSQFEQFLEPLGATDDLAADYRFLSTHTYEGTQYGLAIGGNANGVIYNKAVFEEAGITDPPTSEEEFLDALQAVADETDAIPLYTNYKDGWPLTQGMGSLGSITHDPDAGIHMAENPAPWTAGTDIYALDSLLYEAVAAGLTEADPLTTNWEQSKVDLATGGIGAMVLGSWAISQMQAAAEENGGSAEDIGYMAWPANVDGQQYSVIGGDYNLGISKHSENKAAAWAFLEWLITESGFTETQGMVSTVAAKDLPDNLSGLAEQGVELMETNPAPAGKESLLSDISNDSQIDLWGPLYRQAMIDVARGAADGDKESYFAELNERWGQSSAALAG